MANQSAIFKKIKLEGRELTRFQENIAEKFKKIDGRNTTQGGAVSTEIGVINDDLQAIKDEIGNLPISQGMILGTRVSNTVFSQNTPYASVVYTSSGITEVSFLPDNGGRIVSNQAATITFQLLRNGIVINSQLVKATAAEILHYGVIRLYDLSPTGSAVTYTVRHQSASTIQILNTYIYAKEV